MSGDRSLFLSLYPIDPVDISGAFGTSQPASHMGVMVLPGVSSKTNTRINIMIPGTLYCENLPVTLLSLHQLATDGCKFFGDLNSLWINGLPGDSSIIAMKNLQSRLWEIKQLPT
ncbi:hypothetical protein CROQUDRAFT_101122 [Cronartium quercuum f. sp. fusiforme G11]|uniref:Uncharacterized protein n=1 Tax=Cronartium quercuum f. sp. fusiforme G11 TaxID=708437 RepID=A0A9P6N5M6_9BASI|nr:hypothetical protein CROQUDRAFT_101122 [Cronartium quercuum f. sp. fusiforme G11]